MESQMGKAHVVIVGSSNTDLTVVTDRLPEPGETVTNGRFYESGGGKGANQAVAAHRAGSEVQFVGRVGDDRFGRATIERLREEGINTNAVTIDADNASGVALILVDADGENLIGVAPGANHAITPEQVEACRDIISSSDVLASQLELPMEVVDAALSVARDNGVITVLDPAPVPEGEIPNRVLKNVSILTPNQAEAAKLAGMNPDCEPVDAASKLRERGPEAVAVTLGSDGVLLSTADRATLFPAAHAESVDAVGAGDCFAAVLGMARGEGRPWEEAAEMAVCAASLATESPGAQKAMPERNEIMQRMKTYDADPREL